MHDGTRNFGVGGVGSERRAKQTRRLDLETSILQGVNIPKLSVSFILFSFFPLSSYIVVRYNTLHSPTFRATRLDEGGRRHGRIREEKVLHFKRKTIPAYRHNPLFFPTPTHISAPQQKSKTHEHSWPAENLHTGQLKTIRYCASNSHT